MIAVKKGIAIIATNINNINFLVMGRMGVTEIFILLPIIGFLIYLSYRTAFRYGKTSGRNELLEEIREEEKSRKSKNE